MKKIKFACFPAVLPEAENNSSYFLTTARQDVSLKSLAEEWVTHSEKEKSTAFLSLCLIRGHMGVVMNTPPGKVICILKTRVSGRNLNGIFLCMLVFFKESPPPHWRITEVSALCVRGWHSTIQIPNQCKAPTQLVDAGTPKRCTLPKLGRWY